MANSGNGYVDFERKKEMLEKLIERSTRVFEGLGMKSQNESAARMRQRVRSERFKVMVVGEFKRGKSTFINALLGQEVLPSEPIPCTAVINEVKYAKSKKAILHFRNPLPSPLPDSLPEPAVKHIKDSKGKVPTMEISVDDLYDYVVIPDPAKDQSQSVAETPYEKVELYWPLPLCESGVEIIDSPGLNENGVRTLITTDYLTIADAVLFVMSCQALASENEMRIIDINVRGAGHEDIFFICNRFDEIRRGKERVIAFGQEKLAPKTNLGAEGIFFISALEALEGRLDDNEARVEGSGILKLESALEKFLTTERGKIKLLQPARELTYSIREARNSIPNQKKMLEHTTEEIEARYNQIKPKLDDLEHRKGQITRRIDNHREKLKMDVRKAVEYRMRDISELVPKWIEEIETENTIKVYNLNIQAQATALVNEILEKFQNRMDLEQSNWRQTVLTPMIQQKIGEITSDIESKVEDFYQGIDQIKLDMSGIVKTEGASVKQASGVERFFAAVGGLLLGDISTAFVGAQWGFKEMLKNIGIQIGLATGMIILGLTNPVTLIPVLLGAGVAQLFYKSVSMSKTIKKKVTEEMITKIKDGAFETAENIANAVFDQTQKITEAAEASLSKEIKTVKEQIEEVLKDKRTGEAQVQSKKTFLNSLQGEVEKIDSELMDFIFALAGNKVG